MASWVLAHPPWHSLARGRLRWDHLIRVTRMTGKQFLNTPTLPTSIETPMMRAMKAYPYPSSPLDASLFEESTEEYHDARHTLDPTEEDVNPHPSDILKELVKQERFEDVERVYAELVNANIEIRPHPAYHFVARRILSTDTKPSQARLDAFVKWWSLVPSKDEVFCRRSVYNILVETLHNDPVPDIPLIANFALLAASKGYGNLVAPHVVIALARYAPSPYTLRFLEKLCNAAWHYKTSMKADNASLDKLTKQLLKGSFSAWYSYAVRTFAHDTNFDSALDAYKIACERGIFITPVAFRFLLRGLLKAEKAQDVDTVQALWEGGGQEAKISPLPMPSNLPLRLAIPDSRDVQKMAAAARQVKQALRERVSLHAKTLTSLINAFLSEGRLSLLARLRRLAYRSGDASISTWVLAEMNYYESYHPDATTLIPSIFRRHFFPVGIPMDVLEPFAHPRPNLWVMSAPRPNGDLPLLGDAPPIHRRLHPTHHHVYILWNVAAHSSPRLPNLITRYRAFVRSVAASRGFPSSFPLSHAPLSTDDGGYVEPRPPYSLYKARTFNIFLENFKRFNSPLFITYVILDLFRMGLKPDQLTENTFIDSLHIKPTIEDIRKVLEYWERKVNDMCKDLETWPSTVVIDSIATRKALLEFLYLGMMKRLIKDDRPADAREVGECLQRLFPSSDLGDALRDTVMSTDHIGRDPLFAGDSPPAASAI
ncbi:hypothetical protein C8Q80DRAFT_226623 [Daedaleopsis nitida]|nr:hypothetical protein C8Q80DRAFT_226623 [Daedaleopsis nitida]